LNSGPSNCSSDEATLAGLPGLTFSFLTTATGSGLAFVFEILLAGLLAFAFFFAIDSPLWLYVTIRYAQPVECGLPVRWFGCR
jgi:hypothetical protein